MEKDAKKFDVKKRMKSFGNAKRGIKVFFAHTHNAWIHAFVFVCVLILALYFSITKVEWMMLFIASGFVFVSEAFNTAIEIDLDLTSPEYHDMVRDSKDVSAGAVLLSALIAVIIGLIIFVPYILKA